MSIAQYRFEVAREYYNEEIDAYVTDPFPVLFGTREEAEALKGRLLAGQDRVFFPDSEDAGFLEVFELIVDPKDGSVRRTGA